MNRLISLGLALVLSLGLAGTALAVDPRTDPVSTGNPAPPTDPVFDAPWWSSWWHAPLITAPVEVRSTGTTLAGTYVGTVGYRRYVPAFQYQLLYSDPQGGYSCTAYSAAMAIDKATYGGTRVTGREIRSLSGVIGYIGMTLTDVRVATDKLRVSIVRVSGTWADVMTALREQRGVVLQGVYSQVPLSLRGQASFTGRHAIFLSHLHSTGLYVYVMDPLNKGGGRWWPVAVLQKFADELGRETGVSPLVFYSYTRATRLFR